MKRTLLLSAFLLLPTLVLAAGAPQPLIREDMGEDSEAQQPAQPGIAHPPTALTRPDLPAPLHPIPAIAPPHREAVVEKNELAAPVLTSYGTLDEKSGSLAMDIWKNLQYPEATAALDKASSLLDAGGGTIALADLLRRAALSRAYEPEGGAEFAAAFFKARIRAARATGDLEGALALEQKRPDVFTGEDWARLIEDALLNSNVDKACALYQQHLAGDTAAQKIGILCEIRNNQPDAARLHLDLLREAGESDAAFLELGERALNPRMKPAQKVEAPSALAMALAIYGKVKLTPEMLPAFTKNPRRVFAAMAAPDAARARVIELFAQRRTLTRQDVETLFAAMPLAPRTVQQLRAAPEQILAIGEKELPTSLRRVAALRAIAEEDSLPQKARILAAAMPVFGNADLLGSLGDSLLIDAQSLAPTPENAVAAPAMLRLLLLRMNDEKGRDAAAWWHLATTAPQSRDAVLPLFPLALYRGLIAEDDRASWFEAYGRTQAVGGYQKSLSYALLKTLGIILPSDVETQLAAQNFMPTGEVATLAQLLELTGTASATEGKDALLRAIPALKAMHQDGIAQQLALLWL